MNEKRFRLELSCHAVIDNAEICEADGPNQRLIKSFINTLVQHPDALLAHYKQNLLHTRLVDDDNHSLKKLLEVTEDDRHLLNIAALSSEEVKQFIYDVFSPSDASTPRLSNVEKEQALLAIEEKLGALQITNAVFTMLNP